ncbi:hypothetical protein QIP06_gp3 [ssRNA phage Esthiorhiza.4_5]|uniref:Uncharacterized protein n=2 Tax=Leviviricetes TaxID=2842243 RepID=A0A8S5L2D0_9VIRU|nr:hypothetical protein QIP06_gp3 [ssRNA phage Esthiorhiza.4_5]QDH90669.1 MAG: hypothetical protein H4RhizoLitter20226_000002 [Leviviridae sp.]DAD51298.1 TPA_asm: hypothetical protein [ssRNA phage Esthiorhiza.4_5]
MTGDNGKHPMFRRRKPKKHQVLHPNPELRSEDRRKVGGRRVTDDLPVATKRAYKTQAVAVVVVVLNFLYLVVEALVSGCSTLPRLL